VVTETEGPEIRDALWDERFKWWNDQKSKTGMYVEYMSI